MTSQEAFGLARIGQIAINVHDLGRAVTFYRDTLGMRLLFEAPPRMAFFDCGGVRLLLGVPDRPEHDHPASVLYYQVEDIQAAHRTLTERGVEFEAPPQAVHRTERAELWIAFFRDPDRNLLALMSEVAIG